MTVRVAGAIVLIGVALTLAGCTRAANLTAELREGDIVFAVCEAATFDGIRVATIDKKSHEENQIWHATGDADVARGFQFSMDSPPDGFLSDQEDGSPELAGHWVELHLENGTDSELAAQFDGDDLLAGGWQKNGGGAQSDAC